MGRRSKGDGSVYQRKDGRWVGKYAVELPGGRKKDKYVYAETRKEAAAKLRAALAERESGLVYNDGSLTLGEYLDKWLGAVRDTVKERTYRRHEEVVRLHIKPALGGVRLSRLSPMDVQALYRAKLEAGLSARTVQIVHATLHKALRQAVRWRLVPRNIAEDVDPPRPPRREVQPLSAEQARALLDAAHGDPLEALYVLAVTTGMRQGELLGLKWEDVDLEGGAIRVRRTVWGGKASAPKTAAARRRIGLSRRACAALQGHREWVNGSEWVFSSKTGLTPFDAHHLINRSWIPLRKKAGLPDITRFHDLRHTAATLLLTQSVHPKVVSEMLGHANISITLDTYSHVIPGLGDAAAGAMDDALE